MAAYEVLNVTVDDSDDEGCIRIRCANNIIKYIIIKPNTLGYEVPPARSQIAARLPELPSGDWTAINLFQSNGQLRFDTPEQIKFASIEDLWHPLTVDYFDLELKSISFDVFEAKIKQGRGNLLSSSRLPSPMIAKICAYPDRMRLWNRENKIYQKLHNKGIAPEFLGYITENNSTGPRVIGFLLQKVEGHHALSLSDFPLCLAALQKFHAATGCVHGDANRGNFIIIEPDCSKALIIDFSFSHEGDKDNMQSEARILEECMREDDESKRDIGEENFLKEDLRDRVGSMKPMTEEEDRRRAEIGVDAWVEEKIEEIIKRESHMSPIYYGIGALF